MYTNILNVQIHSYDVSHIFSTFCCYFCGSRLLSGLPRSPITSEKAYKKTEAPKKDHEKSGERKFVLKPEKIMCWLSGSTSQETPDTNTKEETLHGGLWSHVGAGDWGGRTG